MKSIKPGIRQPRAAIAGHLAALAAVAMWGYSFVSSRELLINEQIGRASCRERV